MRIQALTHFKKSLWAKAIICAYTGVNAWDSKKNCSGPKQLFKQRCICLQIRNAKSALNFEIICNKRL